MAVYPYTAMDRSPSAAGAGTHGSGHHRLLKNEFFNSLLEAVPGYVPLP